MYICTYVFRAVHLILNNLSWGLSPEKTNSPSLRSHWLPITRHLVGGPCEISLNWQRQLELPLCLFCLGILSKFHWCSFHIMSRRPYVIWITLIICLIIFDIFISLFLRELIILTQTYYFQTIKLLKKKIQWLVLVWRIKEEKPSDFTYTIIFLK